MLRSPAPPPPSGAVAPLALLICALAVVIPASGGRYIGYNTTAGTVKGKINVHLVPHSHDDVGWLKTVDQYYVGGNNTIQDEISWKSSHITIETSMENGYALPPNVAIITLEDLDDGTTLLRLAHLYEASEDVQHSTMAMVEIRKLFAKKVIRELTETSLSANQLKSKMKKMKWRLEGDAGSSATPPIRGRPVDNASLIVELGPMEIRTFLLKF